jgi:hypothetical protein
MTKTRFGAAMVLAAGLFGGLTAPASAVSVTYGIEIAGNTGSFDAPDTGGLIEAFTITIDGVTFDTLGVGGGAPTYDPVDNDIRGNPGTEGFVLNSTASGACAALECVLSLEDSIDPGVIPPLYAIFPLVMGIPGTVFASGEYEVTPPDATNPIPVPAPFGLLAGGLVLLWATGRRRTGRQTA